ncbi:uncharacterized protein NKAPD1 isoform X2 [Spea bombifrons]|uniref:uncharacterized protein NKAPD1 isoform X2 n=1 Tax=Spea bombifrons TaxID=233779 RepID=UPI00234B4F33|nr:uncharacterized protein NKAPD1 isoform X2 [Spea bombifrons]XP_053307685.1 uncharacterized protein NKAPD1 isoform X2 [Spea bombifrons]XP_053307686.1 uncharacterized protein NKAPD1 isoform X2 [Spea bombifrons]
MNVKMSRVPLGKVLLRNVIRHTDAHNKLQEESEMWKIREMEKQAQNLYGAKRRRTSPEPNKWDHNGYKELYPEEFGDSKSRMRSDGFDADVKKEAEKRAAVSLEEDALSIRALNKKFYKCESSMPDRWGHSGYKELYPEEFDSDSDTEDKRGRKKANGQETRRDRDPKEPQSHKRKRSKKTRKKKQKKRSHKKLKKQKKDHEVSTETSSESDSSDDSVEKPKKSKRKKKTRKKTARRKQPSSSGQDSDSSDEMSSTEDVEAEKRKDRHSKKNRKKQHHRSKPKKDSEMEWRKSRRTNWKVAKDEGSDSSDEDD